MLGMENSEEILQILERYSKLKPKDIPKELEDYLSYVAKTGDTVYRWSNIKHLFREKLMRVIKDFHDNTPSIEDLPQYPNVDPFNYESMKTSLLERLEMFNSAPFTVQRLCELLTDPRKQYNRIDKYMRALEKNILVVSTIEPGRKPLGSENGDSLDSVVNGDLSLDVNVEIDMENESIFNIGTSESCTTSTITESNNQNSTLDERKPETKIDDEEPKNTETEKGKTDENKTLDTVKNEEHVEIIQKIEKSKDITEDEEKLSKDEDNFKEANDKPSQELVKIAKISEEAPSKAENEESETTEIAVSEEHETESKKNAENVEKSTEPDLLSENKEIDDNAAPIASDVEEKTNNISLPVDDTKPIDSDATVKNQQTDDAKPESISTEPDVQSTTIDPESAIVDSSSSQQDDFIAETTVTATSKIPEQMSVEEVASTVEQQRQPTPPSPPAATLAIVPDQPMDENLETTNNPAETVACINEVDMSTDLDVPTKSTDTAVMDIDDTSQEEAMDQ